MVKQVWNSKNKKFESDSYNIKCPKCGKTETISNQDLSDLQNDADNKGWTLYNFDCHGEQHVKVPMN